MLSSSSGVNLDVPKVSEVKFLRSHGHQKFKAHFTQVTPDVLKIGAGYSKSSIAPSFCKHHLGGLVESCLKDYYNLELEGRVAWTLSVRYASKFSQFCCKGRKYRIKVINRHSMRRTEHIESLKIPASYRKREAFTIIIS